MQIGFDIRTPAAVAEPVELMKLVRAGEDMGFDYMTMSDHLVQTSQAAKYNNSPDAAEATTGYGRCHEQLTAIAFLAGMTHRLRFVTAVTVLPYRPAVLAAKMMATIDVLSGGRLTVGVGTGWIEDEFAALGIAHFAARGRLTDEYIQAIRSLWTDEVASFKGEYVRFSDIALDPKPVQRPHPPIWVGGMSRPAMRRTASFADAWYPMLNDDINPLDSLSQLRAGIAELRAIAETQGRDPGSLRIALRVARHGLALSSRATDGERRLFAGPVADFADDIGALRSLGIIAIDFRFENASADRILSDMAAFQSNVLANV